MSIPGFTLIKTRRLHFVALLAVGLSHAQTLKLHRFDQRLELSIEDVAIGHRSTPDPVFLIPEITLEVSQDLTSWQELDPENAPPQWTERNHVKRLLQNDALTQFFRVKTRLPSLSGLNLNGFDLSQANLEGVDLSGSSLQNANLAGSDLRDANLNGADLRGADLRGAKLSSAKITGAQFNGANLLTAEYSKDDFSSSTLESAITPILPEDIGFEVDVAFDRAGGGVFLGAAPAPGNTLGFAVGGANDVGNFRQNIENEFLPLDTDITYEGLFYDYFFETGETEACDSLFCPSYSQAKSIDPFNEQSEIYLAVGLNSGIQEADFQRKQLNLVIVLDVSGSMRSPFDQYYYDSSGQRLELEDIEASLAKMDVAIDSVLALLNHLTPDDRMSLITFNNQARVEIPLSRFGNLDSDELRRTIRSLAAGGGTNLSAGIRRGTSQLTDFLNIDPEVSENRILFVTDAMPNQGETSRSGLVSTIQANAAQNIYTTVIGVGVDFNTDLIESISKNKGANYYSVHSPTQFIDRMDEGFDYMVTPLVFDLKLRLDGDGWSIRKVYGSPEANEATGELMNVATLFPSRRVEGSTRGGLILLRLTRNPAAANRDLDLAVSYSDRAGKTFETTTQVQITETAESFYDNTGIRKGILLSRYANLMKDWIRAERESYAEERPIAPAPYDEVGILIPPIWPAPEAPLGEWERQSTPLFVAKEYQDIFAQFRDYFKAEMDAIGDESLNHEIEILTRLTTPNFVGDQSKEAIGESD